MSGGFVDSPAKSCGAQLGFSALHFFIAVKAPWHMITSLASASAGILPFPR